MGRSGIVNVDPAAGVADGLVLRLPFFSATAAISSDVVDSGVWFVGELPEGVGRARLTHQGIFSVIDQLREQKLGIGPVDAAFLVFCDDDGFALLTRCGDALLKMVPAGVSASCVQIHIEEKGLRVLWPADDIAALPALWESLVSLRSGA